MIHRSNNEETNRIADIMVEGLKQQGEAFTKALEELQVIAYSALDNVVDVENKRFIPISYNQIFSLSHTQLWVLCFYGVFNSLMTNTNIFAVENALKTFFEENSEEMPHGYELNEVEVTNCIFDTEFDTHFVSLGFEYFITVLSQNIQSEQTED